MACTIGGNVANNSGGPHCFKHGATTRHIRGLVIVTHDGEILDLSEPAVDPAGYDLVGLFTGSEGTFGIATEVTVKLIPRPPVIEVQLALFADLDAACDSVSDIIAARLEPSALEILDKLTIEAVARLMRLPTPRRLLIAQGSFADEAALLRYADELEALHHDPSNAELRVRQAGSKYRYAASAAAAAAWPVLRCAC